MDRPETATFTAFQATRRLAAGDLANVALAVKAAETAGSAEPILIYEDATGKAIDLDTRGNAAEVAARYATPTTGELPRGETPKGEIRGRGRPRLGVVPREVTLLPRHWDWLAEQPGGASVTLRKLVDEARKQSAGWPNRRAALDAAYHFMSAMAGDLPHFEDAIRALYAGDRAGLERHIAAWPKDVRDHTLKLGYGEDRA